MKMILFTITLFLSTAAIASEIAFQGHPVKKIEVGENHANTSILTEAQSEEYKVTIIKEGNNYYWATRGNVELVPNRSGFYITYVAINGAGYVRTMAPEAVAVFKQLPVEEQAKQFLYFEHLVHQMGSITYYGK